MIIIRMTGGLGNQMFQYALYLKLRAMGKEVKMDDFTEYEGREARPLSLWAFGIEHDRASREELCRMTDGFLDPVSRIRRKLFGRKSLEYMEKDCNFDPEILNRDPAYLTGYFQSEKYFADIEEEVRQAFRFSERIWEGIPSQLLERIRSYEQQIKTTMAVSVHIRRGDYLQNEEAYGGICTERYYKTAIEYVKKRQQDASFFVFTNDPDYAGEWILKNFGQEKERFVLIEGTQEENGYLDLYLMSLCRHHILANSSFSWWGAYLNPSREKMVIVPHKWFGNQECRDIYMENMIRIAKEQS